MKTIFLSLLFVCSSGSVALACNVHNYKDAIKCIQADAYKRLGEGELSHSVGATRTNAGKVAFHTITGVKARSAYVGVVEVHYDEDELLYYKIDSGTNVEPVLVSQFNITDITYDNPELEELARMDQKSIEAILSLHIPLVGTMKEFHY